MKLSNKETVKKEIEHGGIDESEPVNGTRTSRE